MKDNNQELALLIAILRCDHLLIEQHNLFADVDFQKLYQLILRHKVVNQVCTYINKFHPNLSLETLQQLTALDNQQKFRAIQMFSQLIKITRLLAKNNIPYIVVKGIPLAQIVYGSFDQRFFCDIDIWIKIDDLAQIITIMQENGYIQKLPQYELTGFKRDYFFKHLHDVAFFHPQLKVSIELHFKLEYTGLKFYNFNQVSTMMLMINSNEITTLTHDYHLLYIMIHASIHAWTNLYWLNDIAWFIKLNICDLQQVIYLARQINCQHIVAVALILVRDLYNILPSEVEGFVAASDNKVLKLVNLAKEFIAAKQMLGNNYGLFSGIFFKYRNYLRLLAISGNKTSAQFRDWFKIDNIFPYLTLPRKFAFCYYLIYPFWVVKRIATSKR